MSEAQIWYSRSPDQRVLSADFENVIVLSDEFYKEIVDHPVPNDLEAVKVLVAAPALLDLYMWLSYRCFAGRRSLCLAHLGWPTRSVPSSTRDRGGSNGAWRKSSHVLITACSVDAGLSPYPRQIRCFFPSSLAAGECVLALGRPVIYCANSRALAVPQTLVHTRKDQIPSDYVFYEMYIEETSVEEVRSQNLPADWKATEPSQARDFGSEWMRSRRSLALLVPSVVIAEEHNLLLNPEHPSFAQLRIRGPRRCELIRACFDKRRLIELQRRVTSHFTASPLMSIRAAVARRPLPVGSIYSCGTRIIPEQPSETLPAFNAIAGAATINRIRKEKDVALPLMIPLAMEVRNVMRRSEPSPNRTSFDRHAPNVPRVEGVNLTV